VYYYLLASAYLDRFCPFVCEWPPSVAAKARALCPEAASASTSTLFFFLSWLFPLPAQPPKDACRHSSGPPTTPSSKHPYLTASSAALWLGRLLSTSSVVLSSQLQSTGRVSHCVASSRVLTYVNNTQHQGQQGHHLKCSHPPTKRIAATPFASKQPPCETILSSVVRGKSAQLAISVQSTSNVLHPPGLHPSTLHHRSRRLYHSINLTPNHTASPLRQLASASQDRRLYIHNFFFNIL